MLPPGRSRPVAAGLKMGAAAADIDGGNPREPPLPGIADIAVSGLRAASLGLRTSAHNLANLSTPDAARQGVALSAAAGGGVAATVVEAPADPTAPLEDVAAMLAYRTLAGANLAVLRIADQTLGSLLDVRA